MRTLAMGVIGAALLAGVARAEDPAQRARAAAFVRLLGDAELGDVARRTVEAMGADAIPALAAAIGDVNASGRPVMAELLAKAGSGSEQARDALRRASADRDLGLRVAALRGRVALGEETEPLVPGFVSALNSPDENVRRAAAAALKEAGREARSALPVLMRALEDPDARVRADAAAALQAMGVAAVDSLGKGIRSENPVLRTAAVRTMGALGTQAKGAVPAMLEVLVNAEEDPELRRETARALGGIGRDAGAAVPELLKIVNHRSADPGLRSASLAALESIGTGTLDLDVALRSLLRHEEARMRAWATRGVGAMGADAAKATADLMGGLNDVSHLVRGASAMALVRVAPDDAGTLALLEAGVRGRLLISRATAAGALGALGGKAKSAIPALEKLAADEENPAHAAAAQAALERIRG